MPTSVSAVTHHNLPFSAHTLAGLGYNGDLILGDWDSERYLYKMQHNGKGYIETWKKELPDGMKYDCNKGVSSDEYIFLQNIRPIDEKTVCYDNSVTKTTELYIQGELTDSISDEVFYKQGTLGKKNWQIIVHKPVMEGQSTSGGLASALQNLQLDRHRILKPPSAHRWGSRLSVCRMKLGYVVVEYFTSSMDIFDEDGRKSYALKLYFIAVISVRK